MIKLINLCFGNINLEEKIKFTIVELKLIVIFITLNNKDYFALVNY